MTFHDERLQAFGRSRDGSGQPGRPGPDDDDVVLLQARCRVQPHTSRQLRARPGKRQLVVRPRPDVQPRSIREEEERQRRLAQRLARAQEADERIAVDVNPAKRDAVPLEEAAVFQNVRGMATPDQIRLANSRRRRPVATPPPGPR
jgi:hypothetical protein